jgi:hypothetical protein
MNNYLPPFADWEKFSLGLKDELKDLIDDKNSPETDWAYEYLKDIRNNLADIFSFADTPNNNASAQSLLALAYLQVNSLRCISLLSLRIIEENEKQLLYKMTDEIKKTKVIAYLWANGSKYIIEGLANHLAEGEQELLDAQILAPLRVRCATQFLGEQYLLNQMYSHAVERPDLAASWERYVGQEISFSKEQQDALVHHGTMLRVVSQMLFAILPTGEQGEGEGEHARAWGAFYHHLKTSWSLLNVLNILKNENRDPGMPAIIGLDQIYELYKTAILSSFIEALELHIVPAEIQRVHLFIAHTSGEAIEKPLTREEIEQSLEANFGTSSISSIRNRFKSQEQELSALREQIDVLLEATSSSNIEEATAKYIEADKNLRDMGDFDSMINKFEDSFSFIN